MTKSQFKCPLCNKDLQLEKGHAVNRNDGITIFCIAADCCMEDWGHGKNEKEAFEVFKQKCGK